MPDVPRELADLTAPWLSAVLDTEITRCAIADSNTGTTGRAVLDIEAPGSDLPPRLFVKLPPTDEMQRAFVTATGMGRNEALFYATLADEVPVRVPASYYAASDEAGESYIMLLEHLEDSGCTFQNASTLYSLDYVRSILSCFARLHAAYWETPRFADELDWIQPPARHDIATALVEQALSQYGATMPAVFTDLAELFLAETDAFYRIWGEGAHTLVHGDVHDANLFFDHGQPGFLDWAIASRAPAMRDVGYFLAGTLADEDRNMGRQLLDEYRQQLLALGVAAPSLDELWQQYQWHAAYVWVGATVTLAMGDAWQPVSYVMASLERLHGALQHLGSVDAIRSAA